MDSFFVRYRNIVVLLVILLAQIIGLATQVRRTDSGHNALNPRDDRGVLLIRLWANALVSPPEELIHATRMGIAGLWQNYVDLRQVRAQNQQLQQTISRLRLEQAELLEDARQGQRLQALLGFQEKYIYKTLAAQVFGSSGSEQSRVFYIDKGSADGLRRDMPVITADGIVGKVRDVFPRTAQVLAINDQTSGAGVILATTRIRGILRGDAAGQLEVVDITADERIKPGEPVLTAGGDMVFPRGLPVGEVEKVVPDPEQDSFVDVIVKPAAHLNRLDEVLVITSTEPRFPPQGQRDLDTSQALDGAQAAAIAEQQKAAQITAERLPNLVEPNVPPDQQPLNDTSPPNPMAQPPQPLHPDQFSPSSVTDQGSDQPAPAGSATPRAQSPGQTKQSPAVPTQPSPQRSPRRNP
ncbi:MAG: rod shape-determining protein MreC [Acidobacteriota bacterium]